jgi:hypothetical protein
MRFGTQPAAIQGGAVSLVTINGITAVTSCLDMLASRALGSMDREPQMSRDASGAGVPCQRPGLVVD